MPNRYKNLYEILLLKMGINKINYKKLDKKLLNEARVSVTGTTLSGT